MKKALAIILCFLLAACLIAPIVSSVSVHPFVDVPEDTWYSDAVQWAWETGVTEGVDASHFDPDRPITRAEMVTMLWRMNGNAPEIDIPEETPKPTTFADRPKDPYMPEPTIHPEYQNDYYGRLTFYENFDRYSGTEFFSIGLYDSLDSEMVDLDDSAFIMKRGNCYAIGDHNYPSFWIIRYSGPGDVIQIRKKDGSYERYKYMFTDTHVRNAGSDFLFDNAESCFFAGADLFLVTCNDDGGGTYVTATFWKRIM